MQSGDFEWRGNASVVIPRVDAIAVYLNDEGDVVIRQCDGVDHGIDSCIVLSSSHVDGLCDALRRAAREAPE